MDEVERCKKCLSVMEDEGGGNEGLCDNCNMELIAQNLAAELKNHKVVEEVEAGEGDVTVGEVAVVEVVSPSSQDSDSFNIGGEPAESVKPKEETPQQNTLITSGSPLDTAVENVAADKDDNVDVGDDNNEDKEILKDDGDDGSEGTDVGSPLPSPVGSNASDGDDDDGWRKEKRRRGSTTSEEEENAEEEEEDEGERRILLSETMVTRRRGVRMAIPAPMTAPVPITAAKALAGEIPPMTGEDSAAVDSGTDDEGPVPPRRLTRRALAEIDKYMHPQYEQQETRSKSRRSKLFKSTRVYKAPTAQARIFPSDYAFHKGRYFQIGDVCATRGLREPSKIYYCQITSLLTDQYCHKCATIQWLFPTQESPDPCIAFDPRTYFLGFLDESPRPLDCLMPVMNCPPTYFNLDGSYDPPNRNIPSYLHIRLRPIYVQEFMPSNPD